MLCPLNWVLFTFSDKETEDQRADNLPKISLLRRGSGAERDPWGAWLASGKFSPHQWLMATCLHHVKWNCRGPHLFIGPIMSAHGRGSLGRPRMIYSLSQFSRLCKEWGQGWVSQHLCAFQYWVAPNSLSGPGQAAFSSEKHRGPLQCVISSLLAGETEWGRPCCLIPKQLHLELEDFFSK